jgi:hypothetical protein
MEAMEKVVVAPVLGVFTFNWSYRVSVGIN